MAVYGNKPGEACYRDSDCESGLLCIGRAHQGFETTSAIGRLRWTCALIYVPHSLVTGPSLDYEYIRLCRACMHSFFIDCQSLRELRITSVLKNAAFQKEMWVGSNVTACSAYFSFATSDPHLLAGFPRLSLLQLQAQVVWSEYSLQ